MPITTQVHDVVVSVPTYFTDAERRALLDAARYRTYALRHCYGPIPHLPHFTDVEPWRFRRLSLELSLGGHSVRSLDSFRQGFGSGSARIRINLSCWIRIRIRIQIADPDPGGQK